MISDHGAKLVVCTPTKCGKTSLEAMVMRERKEGRIELEVIRPGMHRLDMPFGSQGYRKAMMVRNPWARLVSTRSFLGNPISKSEFYASEVQWMDFDEFVRFWLKERHSYGDYWRTATASELWSAPARWLMTLGECAELWEPSLVVRLEHLQADLLEVCEVDYGDPLRRNHSDKVRKGHWTDYYTKRLWNLVGDHFAYKEAEVLGNYPLELSTNKES